MQTNLVSILKNQEKYQTAHLSLSDLNQLKKIVKLNGSSPLGNINLISVNGLLQVEYRSRQATIGFKTGFASGINACLPAKEFFAVISSATKESHIEITVEENKATLRTNFYKIEIPTIPTVSGNMSHMPDIAFDKQPEIKLFWDKTLLAPVARHSPRNYGTVVRFEILEGTTRVIGTDGFRLTYTDNATFNKEFDAVSFSLPLNSTKILGKILDGYGSQILGYSDSHGSVSVSAGNFYTCLRLSPVNYPNYKEVIKDKTSFSVNFDGKPFAAILKQAAKCTDKSRAGKLSLDNGLLVIETIDVNKCNHKFTIPYNFSNTTVIPPVSLNLKFLLDCFTGKKEVKIRFNCLEHIDNPVFIREEKTTTVLVSIKPYEE
jgi:DNA polymerase III sliding clamp (beta) subunit (PCNA family)